MTNRDGNDLDRKLARGQLSGPEKERILNRVLQQVRAGRTASRGWVRRLSAWLLSGAAAAAALVATLVSWPEPGPGAPEGFRAKGTGRAGPSGPGLEAFCPESCILGETLMFRVGALEQTSHLTAFARGRADPRIWYFPTPEGRVPQVSPTESPVVLSEGVRIGPEHGPGVYRVHLLLTRAAPERDEVIALWRRIRGGEQSPEVLGHRIAQIVVKR